MNNHEMTVIGLYVLIVAVHFISGGRVRAAMSAMQGGFDTGKGQPNQFPTPQGPPQYGTGKGQPNQFPGGQGPPAPGSR
jgi:hypothetical protein